MLSHEKLAITIHYSHSPSRPFVFGSFDPSHKYRKLNAGNEIDDGIKRNILPKMLATNVEDKSLDKIRLLDGLDTSERWLSFQPNSIVLVLLLIQMSLIYSEEEKTTRDQFLIAKYSTTMFITLHF